MFDNYVKKEIEALLVNEKPLFFQLKNKSIFVTGATGLLGSQLVLSLLEANRLFNLNIKIIALIRSLEKAERYFKDYLGELEFHLGDITEQMTYEGQVDYVIHGASVTSSLSFVQTPVDTIMTAFQGTKNILDFSVEKGVESFVYLSSLEVYGTFEGRKEVTEDVFGSLNPAVIRSSYSEGKRMAETLVIAYHSQYQLPAKIARLCQTFGPGVSYDDNRVFAQFARSVIEKKDIVLHTEGKTERNYCAISDSISAMLYILIYGENAQAYNVANEDTMISIADLAEKFVRLSNNQIGLQFNIQDISKFGYNPELKLKLKTTKLEKLGWHARISLDNILYGLVQSMRLSKEKQYE